MDLLTPKYKIKEDAGRKEGYIHPYHSSNIYHNPSQIPYILE